VAHWKGYSCNSVCSATAALLLLLLLLLLLPAHLKYC
jgi:hypothetical protein